jgi:D-cysteine desulfhydrase
VSRANRHETPAGWDRVRTDHPLVGRLARPPRCLQLANLPTPVEPAPWIAAGSNPVWIKRDDLSSDLYGGGKVRKLEWVLGNPPYDRDEPVLSVGAAGSNHLVALGLFLRAAGRRLHALTFDQVLTRQAVTNLGVLASIDTGLWHAGTRLRLPWAWLAYRLWRRPDRPGRFLTPGASTSMGCLGFVAAGLELAQQIESGVLPAPAAIFVAAGTAGTAAGLAVGLAIAGVSTHLRLVSSVERVALNRWMLHRKLSATHRELGRRGLASEHIAGGVAALLDRAGVTWSIDHGQLGTGYGVPTAAAERALALAADNGIVLEGTYTAKCLAGLLADGLAVRGPVLFWNTHAGNDLRRHVASGWTSNLPPSLREAVFALDGAPDLVASEP